MEPKRIVAAVEPLSITESWAMLSDLKNNLLLNLIFLVASVLLLAPALGPVPSSNENVYLLYLAKLWDPTLLAGDWTFAGPLYGHLIFSYFFGVFTLWFPLETVAWAGRLLCWILILWGLLEVGKHFRIPVWMASAAIFLWLLYQQSPVGGEWILGTFEGKCVAYIFLFFGLA